MPPDDSAEEDEVAKAVGALYAAFYRLRQAGKLQEEYEGMGALIDMLMKDRDFLRRTGKVKI